jgi:hypothetical protein
VVCVELGPALAAVARRNLAPFPEVEVRVGAFEDAPLEPASFDLVASATAFHWVAPEVRYAKAAAALRAGGALALWWSEHVRTAAGADFFDAVQAVYRREAPELAARYPGLPRPEERPDRSAEIEGSGLFDVVALRRYVWEVPYGAGEYVDLLATYSPHWALDRASWDRLSSGIRELIESRFGGRIVKTYLAILHVARQRASAR